MKKFIKATAIAGIVMISLCAIALGLFATTAYAFTDDMPMTEKELYNETNTYNANDECFENGKIKVTDEGRYETKQYHISYDMAVKNGNRVMSAPQVTVLTHGLGGSARSNI